MYGVIETKEERVDIMNEHRYSYNEIEESMASASGKKCNGPICNGKIRHLSFFYKSNGKFKSTCKKCHLLGDKQRRSKAQNYVDEKKILIGNCEECFMLVTKESTCCFDFDHIDPNSKKTTIARMISQGNNKTLIDNEISKCRLLCCKCHRLHTMKQLNYIDYLL